MPQTHAHQDIVAVRAVHLLTSMCDVDLEQKMDVHIVALVHDSCPAIGPQYGKVFVPLFQPELPKLLRLCLLACMELCWKQCRQILHQHNSIMMCGPILCWPTVWLVCSWHLFLCSSVVRRAVMVGRASPPSQH